MKLIILDRDGVINHDSDHFIKSVDEWQPLPGSLEAMARLYQAGFCIVVATNQSGVARGLYDLATLNRMHDKMHCLLAELGAKVNAIYYCPHGPDDDCLCRKPRPGMYQRAAEQFAIDLDNVPVIGDSWRDLEAAMAVNAQPILLKTGKGLRTIAEKSEQLQSANVPVFEDLADAVSTLLKQ